MIKYLTGLVLAGTIAVAQTPQKPAKPAASAKPASTTAAPSASGPASASAAKPSRPLPEQPLKTKLENRNTANPNYRKEKARGDSKGIQPKYTPRQTESGVRPDTVRKRKS
ncbi:hypothetical protein [Spirosoma utsteinense]|uniref:Uncharacterized protein n=1 Tax=Spirosoma utsteinense TaxID=2585773 RepID=A0ABR6WD45_9BACT|nr:hypothetical protein [Spirosoma utsteinense]MBC3786434.1 hypothetical protein [Spirosoma utsteinense]MBC3793856.1 hypothetical protein [Spirosoma utsteinense]